VSFDGDGLLDMSGGVDASFDINGRHVLHDTVSFGSGGGAAADLAKFLFRCTAALAKEIRPERRPRLFNTNLSPRSYIGMLVQSLAIRLFNCNYTYIMHALTALQRHGGVPLCVGAVSDREEADRYFPGFGFAGLA
jgi:hypothetical protein